MYKMLYVRQRGCRRYMEGGIFDKVEKFGDDGALGRQKICRNMGFVGGICMADAQKFETAVVQNDILAEKRDPHPQLQHGEEAVRGVGPQNAPGVDPIVVKDGGEVIFLIPTHIDISGADERHALQHSGRDLVILAEGMGGANGDDII